MDDCSHCRPPSVWRQRRKALNVTLEQLAVKVGSTAGSLSYFERGVGGLNVETVLRLCDELGIDAGDLPAAWASRGSSAGPRRTNKLRDKAAS